MVVPPPPKKNKQTNKQTKRKKRGYRPTQLLSTCRITNSTPKWPSAQVLEKVYNDDIFSIWNINKDEFTQFIKQGNGHHLTIEFTADTETTFLDTNVYESERFANQSILDIKTLFKPTGTFQ